MRPVSGVKIEGMEDLQETLKDVLPREATNILRRTTFAIASAARDRVKARAPKRTGNLMRSIKAKRNKGTKTQVSASVVADRSGGRTGKGYHSHFVEFGTVKMAAQPFIVPATEELRPQVPEMYRQEFGVQYEREMAKRNKRRK